MYTIEYGSIERLIEVGHGIGKRLILDLAKTFDRSADGVAWLPIEIWNLSRAFSEYSRHIV